MPEYDYTIRVTDNDGESGETIHKGTVTAPDPRTACFVAYAQDQYGGIKELPAPNPDGCAYLTELGLTGSVLESATEAFLDQEPFDPAQFGSEFPKCPESCVLCDYDFSYEIFIEPHDPGRFHKPQVVALTVYLEVQVTDPERHLTWEEIKEHAKLALARRLRTPYEHPGRPIRWKLESLCE